MRAHSLAPKSFAKNLEAQDKRSFNKDIESDNLKPRKGSDEKMNA